MKVWVYSHRSYEAYEDEVMESLFIEIIRSHERNVIVGIIYRPLNQNVSDFVIRMNDVLGKISPGGGVLPRILDRGVPRRFVNPNPI